MFAVVMKIMTFICAGGTVTHHASTKGVTVLIE